MANNEIKESRNEISRIVKKPVENIYGLASLVNVFFGRLIDLILVFIPIIVIGLAWKYPAINKLPDGTIANFDDIKHALTVHTIVENVVWFISPLFFLVFIPSFTKGTTIGKAICGIRLKRSTGDKKVKWYMLLAREAYFVILPLLVTRIIEGVALVIELRLSKSVSEDTIKFIQNIPSIFCLIWYVLMMASIKMQSEHQSWVDMKFGLVVVYKDPIKQIVKEEVVTEKSLILTDQPGNLSKKSMDELDNSEKKKYEKSISLDDLDLKITKETKKKKDDDEPKKIEGDK